MVRGGVDDSRSKELLDSTVSWVTVKCGATRLRNHCKRPGVPVLMFTPGAQHGTQTYVKNLVQLLTELFYKGKILTLH